MGIFLIVACDFLQEPEKLKIMNEILDVMGLRELELKPSYDSEDDDLLRDFYIPALSESKVYYRLAGFFSSCSLALAARGISNLISSGGKMKIVAGAKLQQADVSAIHKGLKDPDKVIAEGFIGELESIEDKVVEDHVKALAWMVANGRVEFRVAVLSGDKGRLLDRESVKRSGYFHMKVGLFEDENGDMVSFSGSLNESCRGWLDNEEEFHVFRSWDEAEKTHLESNLRKFKRYWEGTSRNVVTHDLPEAVRKKIIQIAPANVDNLDLESVFRHRLFTAPLRRLKPWKCQSEAVDMWKKTGRKGIIEMATGTGKTFVALLCIDQYLKDTKPFGHRVLVVVPSRELVRQWKEDLVDFFPSSSFVVRYDASTSNRGKRLARETWQRELEKDRRNTLLVITIDSIKNFKPFKRYAPDFLIADEVHVFGTQKRMATLRKHIGDPRTMLGMSATPERYYDDVGTEMLKAYFGPVIFRYKMKDAQEDGVLSNYKYYTQSVQLESDEEEEVKRLTRRIGQHLAADLKSEISEAGRDRSSAAEKAMIQRAKMIKKARNKVHALRAILEDRGKDLRQCIVYCEDTPQLDDVQGVFDSMGIDSYVRYHSKTINRKQALSLFKKRNCRFVLSMHCLDQGVNIPMCNSLILLSSSSNPREYIQRRGRVLRNPPGRIKPIVKIFDILAFPGEVREGYRGLALAQLVRAWEFIRCSDSPEARIGLQKVLDDYGISMRELASVVEGW